MWLSSAPRRSTFSAKLGGPSCAVASQRRSRGRVLVRTRIDADRWLSVVEADLSRGTSVNEGLSRQTFGNYARSWLDDHPKMGPRYPRDLPAESAASPSSAGGRAAPGNIPVDGS